MTRMYNLAMQFERELHLGAGKYERMDERRGYANGYKPKMLKLAAWMEDNIQDGFTVFSFPAVVRQFLRTNNMEENLNKQIKSRTRLIPAFPNVASLMRLVSAICVEISDDWESGHYKYMCAIKEL